MADPGWMDVVIVGLVCTVTVFLAWAAVWLEK